jgi:uncharacterized membrane protein
MSGGEWNRNREHDGDGESRDEDETPLQAVAAGAVTFLTLGVAFGLMALGNPYFWVAFPVGFGGLMPMAIGLARWFESREGTRSRSDPVPRREDDTDAALADLRERYARGELDDEEFEARVERLLETESVTDAREFAERTRESTGKQRTADAVTDTPDGERERE